MTKTTQHGLNVERIQTAVDDAIEALDGPTPDSVWSDYGDDARDAFREAVNKILDAEHNARINLTNVQGIETIEALQELGAELHRSRLEVEA